MAESYIMLLTNALLACAAAGTLYLLVTIVAVRHFVRRQPPAAGDRPPITVLKPLCGEEPELYENLRSFCRQRYTGYQLVFGVQNPRDPAIALVGRLRREFPKAEIELVIRADRPAFGNGKVANLAGMLPAARHEILVMADADIRVGPDYLAAVATALARPGVGLVTCLYRGRAAEGPWSRLAALPINHAFLPQAIVGELVGIGEGCFGATIALRRATLEAAGGFAAVADRLADDHALGQAVRKLGHKVFLSPYLVDTVVAEPSLSALVLQEVGFLANLLSEFHTSAVAMLACTAICRLISARAIDALLGVPPTPLWLLPVRDALSFWVFATSFLTRTVAWHGQRLRVGPRGDLIHGGR
jgi:ceramide glucosyltransferase